MTHSDPPPPPPSQGQTPFPGFLHEPDVRGAKDVTCSGLPGVFKACSDLLREGSGVESGGTGRLGEHVRGSRLLHNSWRLAQLENADI